MATTTTANTARCAAAAGGVVGAARPRRAHRPLLPVSAGQLPVVAASSLVAHVLPRAADAADAAAASSSGCPTPAQTLALIKRRRSIFPKDFSPSGPPSSITQSDIEQLLEAARWAPTHKLTEPWRFVVIGGQHKAAFEELTIRCCQELLPADKAEATVAKLKKKQQTTWPKVQAYIAICMKRHPEVPEWEEIAAVACGVQNMALQATAQGLAGYWTSWQPAARDAPEMSHLLGLDSAAGDRCLGFYVLGTAEAERTDGYRPRRAPLSDKVVWKL